MSVSRVHHPDLSTFGPGAIVAIDGDEAHHVIRVKRLEVGEAVTVLDGLGRVATGTLHATRKHGRDGWAMDVKVATVETVDRLVPAVHVWSSAPKGDRLASMIEGLSQVGAASWSPLATRHTIVEPGSGKIDRLERVAAESAKQCGRAWMLEIGRGGDLTAGLEREHVVIADASGDEYKAAEGAGSHAAIRLLIGPEGGFAPEEIDEAKAAGARVCKFGPHVMRIETAAVVSAAMVMAAEHGVGHAAGR